MSYLSVNPANQPISLTTAIVISGVTISFSGQSIIARVSGQTIQPRQATKVICRDLLPCSDASGGTVLLSGDVISLTVRNIEVSGNPVYVGGVSGEAPYSGHGFFLQGGDGITLGVSNMNQVKIFSATTSGKKVSYIGVNY